MRILTAMPLQNIIPAIPEGTNVTGKNVCENIECIVSNYGRNYLFYGFITISIVVLIFMFSIINKHIYIYIYLTCYSKCTYFQN